MVKYTPRVEMSRVFPLREVSLSTGTRMMTGRDRSYRRAVRRSVIGSWTPVVDSSTQTPVRKWVQSAFQRRKHYLHQGRFNSTGSLPIAANTDGRNCPLTTVARTVNRIYNSPKSKVKTLAKTRPVRPPETLANYNRRSATNEQLTQSTYPEYATSCGRAICYRFPPAGVRDAGGGSELTFSFTLGASLGLPRLPRSASSPN